MRALLFAVIPGVIFVLVSIGIRVSQLGIDHTIVVIGQEELVAGSPAAIRVTLIADGSGFFMPDRVDGTIVRGDERHTLFCGAVNEDGYALGRNFEVPDLEAGPALLELDIRFDERRRIVRCEVEVVDDPPAFTRARLEDSPPGRIPIGVDSGGNLVQAFTEDRGAPTGLMSVMFIRAQDRKGDPVSIPLELDLPTAEGGEDLARVRTDRMGLGALGIRPADLDFPIKVKGATRASQTASDSGPRDGGTGDEGPAYLFPEVVYSGISASVHNPVAAWGEPIRVSVRQISMGGPLYADLFREGRWVHAGSAWVSRDGEAELEIRPPGPGLYRLQITNSALGAGRTIAVRHVYSLGQGEDATDAIRGVLGRLEGPVDGRWARAVARERIEGGAGFDRDLLGAFALSRLYGGHQEVGRLVSSRKGDDAELSAYKAKVQRWVMVVIIILGLAVALIIGMVAAGAHRRRLRMEAMIMDDAGIGGEELAEAQAGARGARARMILQGAILFAIVIGAFAAIALLVDTLTWCG